MTTYTPEQLARLPRWAKDEMTRLTNELKTAHDRLGEGPATSRIWAAPYSDTPTPLGTRTTIRFALDGKVRGERWIDAELHGEGHLRITTSGSLMVSPSAANSIHVRPVEWKRLQDIDRDNNGNTSEAAQ